MIVDFGLTTHRPGGHCRAGHGDLARYVEQNKHQEHRRRVCVCVASKEVADRSLLADQRQAGRCDNHKSENMNDGLEMAKTEEMNGPGLNPTPD